MINFPTITQTNWASVQAPAIKDAIIATVTKAWENVKPFLTDFAIKAATFLRTAPGIGGLAVLVGAIFAFSADHVDDKWGRLALRICGAAFFIGAGIALGMGIVNGMTVPLF